MNSLYSTYNRKTGRDQYSLSNFYAEGGFVSGVASLTLPGDFSVYLPLSLAGAGLHNYNLHRNNNKSRRWDKLANSSEGIKNFKREIWRNEMRNMARITFILASNSFLHHTCGYSLYSLVGIEPVGYDSIFFLFTLVFSLYSLSGYTSAIDTGNPNKSKIASFFTDMLPPNEPKFVPSSKA